MSAVSEQPTISYEKYRLGNGLEVILSQDRSLPLVSVDIWYHVGAANETAGRTGFAHLFEHMMFTGSKHIARGVADRLLEAAGATDSNASTSFDRTDYHDTVPSNQLELALWTHADRMGYLLDTLDQKALSNQQDVVRNERRETHENRPYGVVDDALFRELFPEGHPYRPLIMGSHVDIQSARLTDVREFFKLYYRPNNATLTIVGDFDPIATRALVDRYFGSLQRGMPVIKPAVITPPITSERRLTVTDQVELERLDLAWLTPAKFQADDAELDIAAEILAGGKSSRLYKKLVYELQLAQDVSAAQESFALTSLFNVQALAREGHTASELLGVVDTEIDRLVAEGPTGAEVERARNQIERSLYESLQRNLGRAELLNTYNQYLDDPGYFPKDLARYQRITVADVQRVVRDRLRRDARVVLFAVPGAKKLDADPPVVPVIRTRGTQAINIDEPWRNKTPKAGPANAPLLPVPQSFKLANGLTVLHLRRASVPVVTAQLIVNAGLGANGIALPGLADFSVAMMEEGTTSRSALQIAEQIDQLGAEYSAQTRRDASALRIDSLARNFHETMALLADIVQDPIFPNEEIERQRKLRLSDIAEARDDAGTLAEVAFARALYGPDHAYGRTSLGTEAALKRITGGDLRTFWQRSFAPDNAALVVVGDIDTDELRALVDKHWGGWRSPALTTSGAEHDHAAPILTPSKARLIIVDKPGAPQTALRVGRVAAARSTPDLPALQVLNEAIGGSFSSRLNQKLREDKGYTYGIDSRFEYGRLPGPFAVRTAVRSDVTAPALRDIVAELKRAGSASPSGGELERARGSLMQSLPAMFETNGAIARSFGDLFAYDLPADYYRGLPARLAAVGASTLKPLAQRYLDPTTMVIVAVGDRRKLQASLKTLNIGEIEIWPIAGWLF